MADVEDLLYSRQLRSVQSTDPVFVSGLPRSGTTLLLNILSETGHFATHTYRDMPFILCPLLWERFSRLFATHDQPRERAHGDGMLVSLDSPESFEEVIWMRFWEDHYLRDRIQPWTTSEANSAFDEFFGQHMLKILLARRSDAQSSLRYLSKNNVVPFREPLQHAASMHKQHLRFLEVHRSDEFARMYVSSVGHNEFGLALRPMDFGSWLGNAPDSETLEYWVRYWIAAYHHVLDHRCPDVRLVSYDTLVTEPATGLGKIAAAARIPPGLLSNNTGAIRPPRPHEIESSNVDGSVLTDARRLHDRLMEMEAQDSVAPRV